MVIPCSLTSYDRQLITSQGKLCRVSELDALLLKKELLWPGREEHGSSAG